MCSKMFSPFLDGTDELSGALARFRHAADELWRVIDSCTSTLRKCDVEDCLDPFNSLGFLRATAHHYYDTFNDNQSHVDSSAMKYGLNRLPTELLSRIFLDVASDMKSTIFLSHVSKRFRSIVNRSPAFWQRFRLSSEWSQEQIRAVAERSAFRSLSADLDVNGDELDSVTAIFSLHSCLEDLSIFDLSVEYAEEVRRRLGFLHFPSLQVLSFKKCHSYIPALQHPQQFFEMPLLRTLDANFLPHNSLAKNLDKLSLDLGLVSLASLLDFLSSTNALQDLSIYVFLMADEAEEEVPDHNPVLLPRLIKLCFRAWEGSMMSASIVAQKIRTSSLKRCTAWRTVSKNFAACRRPMVARVRTFFKATHRSQSWTSHYSRALIFVTSLRRWKSCY
ncbi:hypothetical protein ACEPAI_2308 [Sanghuangporus weigelae]